MGRMSGLLNLVESGALALDVVAAELERANDLPTFLDALERNRRVWSALKEVARLERWSVPNDRQTAFVLGTTEKAAVNDEDVLALVEISRSVSAALAGGAIERIRQRAYFLWEKKRRPHGRALEFWLLAEMEDKGLPH